MAQRVTTVLLCDLCEEETEAAGTVSFGVDNAQFEVDLCERHTKETRELLDSLKGNGRRRTKQAPRAVVPMDSSILRAGDLTDEERELAMSMGWKGKRLSRDISDAIHAQRSSKQGRRRAG